jgi:4-hydroxy-2-oxoheptanedioate aldolase
MEPILEFRDKLSGGQVCIGAGITFSDPLVSDALADGVDFLWIDLEHSPMSPEALAGHLLAARGKRVPGLVRVGGAITPLIKGALDAGADGIIVPQVRTVDEVRQVVADCRYPPLGQRGYGPRVPAGYFRRGGRAFTDRANELVFAAVMIETAEALAALDDILAIPGLDSVVIGPADLSYALGVTGDVEHPTVVAAIESIAARARAAGKFVGAGMGPDADYARTMARRGVQWLQVGSDCTYLYKQMDAITTAFRRQWKAGQ